jgi:hypothetical protein
MKAIFLTPLAVATLFTVACSSYPTTRTPATRTTGTQVGVAASVSISAEAAASIRSYYASSQSSQGRGRGRRSSLPPGVARNLERGKPLPPGLAKQTLPRELVVQLPPLAAGLEYAIVAGKLVLVEIATQVVRQVLLDVVMG